MNLTEFNTQINKLKAVYNTPQKNFYPSERTEYLWRRVRNLDVKTFSKGLEQAIGDNAYAPMTNKIIEILLPEINEASRVERQAFIDSLKGKKFCNMCNNIGLVSMYKKCQCGGAPYSFQCKCECGRRFYPTLQLFHVDLLDDWVLYHKREIKKYKPVVEKKIDGMNKPNFVF